MPLRRVQAFELNDRPWVPAPLRDTIVESLSRTLRWGRILDGLVEPMARFLDRSGTRDVLELGSGAGGPASILAEAFGRRGERIHVVLTDLFPRPTLWAELRDAHPGVIDFLPEPVDATAIPAELSSGRARAIVNVLHHFPEPLAREVLRDAVRSRAPVIVAEGFERNPLGFLSFAPAGLPALAVSPLFAREDRLVRALLVWATPIALAASVWDGVVSTLRVYTERELRDMVGDDPTYEWTYGTYAFAPAGRGYYFHGIPRERLVG